MYEKPSNAEHIGHVLVDKQDLKTLGQAQPYRLLYHVLCEWCFIVAAIYLAVRLESVPVTICAIGFIATRQHALLILMHEFTHRQFSRTHPVLNDTLGDFLTALPFMVTIFGYRRDHFQHHQTTSTDADPNWSIFIRQKRYQFPKKRSQILITIFLHLIGFFGFREFKVLIFDAKLAVDTSRGTRYRQFIFFSTVLAITAYTHSFWILGLYWFLPMLTILVTLMYIRDIGEHFAMSGPGWNATRTTLVGWLEGFLISPHHVNYHAEHHLYPIVPAHALPSLHQILLKNPVYATQAVITKGYLLGVLSEATKNTNTHVNHPLDQI